MAVLVATQSTEVKWSFTLPTASPTSESKTDSHDAYNQPSPPNDIPNFDTQQACLNVHDNVRVISLQLSYLPE